MIDQLPGAVLPFEKALHRTALVLLILACPFLLSACLKSPDFESLLREPTDSELEEAQRYLDTFDVPLPKSWEFETFTMSDDATIRVGRAVPPSPKATLLYVPSYTSSQELVSEFLSYWYENGYEVTAMDLPGQGGSIRRQDDYQKTYTGDWGYYGRSVAEVTNHIAATRVSVGPLVVIGESMGGHSVLRSAHDNGLAEADGLLLLVPAILPNTHDRAPLWYMRLVSGRAVRAGKGSEYAPTQGPWFPNKFAPETYKHCGKRADRIFKNEALYRLRPDLRVGGSTNEYLFGIFQSADELSQSATLPKLQLPVTLVTAGDEIYVQSEISQTLCNEVLRTCEQVHIEEATHCIHIDPPEVQNKIFSTLDSLVDKAQRSARLRSTQAL
ncbi:MAG: alpha/beta hydrolase [Pseudomonadota bacterium]